MQALQDCSYAGKVRVLDDFGDLLVPEALALPAHKRSKGRNKDELNAHLRKHSSRLTIVLVSRPGGQSRNVWADLNMCARARAYSLQLAHILNSEVNAMTSSMFLATKGGASACIAAIEPRGICDTWDIPVLRHGKQHDWNP